MPTLGRLAQRARDKRRVGKVWFRGEMLTVGQIYNRHGRQLGLNYQTIYSRVKACKRAALPMDGILDPPQISEERKAYLDRWTGSVLSHIEEKDSRSPKQIFEERGAALAKVAELLYGDHTK